MKYSYISEKTSKFFTWFIFGNLEITNISKIFLTTINLPKGSHLKDSDSYRNAQIR